MSWFHTRNASWFFALLSLNSSHSREISRLIVWLLSSQFATNDRRRVSSCWTCSCLPIKSRARELFFFGRSSDKSSEFTSCTIFRNYNQSRFSFINSVEYLYIFKLKTQLVRLQLCIKRDIIWWSLRIPKTKFFEHEPVSLKSRSRQIKIMIMSRKYIFSSFLSSTGTRR